MTNAAEVPLSRLELVVLARLSCSRPPSDKVLVKDVAELALPQHSLAQATELVNRSLADLRERMLLNRPRSTLTSKGQQLLRRAIDLPASAELPRWSTICDEYLALMQLGVSPTSSEARLLLAKGSSLSVAVLRTALKHPEATTLEQLCDALLTDALGFSPVGMRMSQVRAHMLAKAAGVGATGTMTSAANHGAKKHLGTDKIGKKPFGRALAKRWAYQPATPSRGAQSVPPPSAPKTEPTKTEPTRTEPTRTEPTKTEPTRTEPTRTEQPHTNLLALVREAIPRVGSDGRFGSEKVFVSAIWRQLEQARRGPQMSLGAFKRWLVTANREQLLDLARADLVSAMDPKLVAESEIDDFGTRFHFVVDRQAQSPRGAHAR